MKSLAPSAPTFTWDSPELCPYTVSCSKERLRVLLLRQAGIYFLSGPDPYESSPGVAFFRVLHPLHYEICALVVFLESEASESLLRETCRASRHIYQGFAPGYTGEASANISLQLLATSYWLLAGQRNIVLKAKCVPLLAEPRNCLPTAKCVLCAPSAPQH